MLIESTLLLIKQYLSRSVSLFPILIATISYFMFAGLGNIAFLFLFIGLAILVPICVFVGNLVLPLILTKIPAIPESLWKSSTADCMFRGGDNLLRPVVPSYWMSAVIFFTTYFLMNAGTLYARDASPGSSSDKVKARKAQAAMGIALISILGIALIIIRLSKSRCETLIGTFVSFLIFIPLGTSWFQLLSDCSADRLTDLFGVISQIVPSSASTQQSKKELCY
jgi:hypothetical protein